MKHSNPAPLAPASISIFPRTRRCRPALFAALALVASGIAGCGPKDAGSGGAESNELVIISPHPRPIQNEFERAFKAKHPEAKIKWLDQGGSSDDLRYVQTRFKDRAKGEGINVDVFFGGGAETFLDLEKDGLLTPVKSDYGIPATLNGVALRGKDNAWVGAVLSGFGILANKKIAARDNLPMPRTWADLGDPRLRDRLELADPRHSGSAHVAFEIVLQTNGWEKGWQVLTAMAGNARQFVTSSSTLPQDVGKGEAVVAPAIDFYAYDAISRVGADTLTYIAPTGQTVTTPDPIGILRDPPHEKLAREWVDFVLSPEGQKLWMYKKGSKGGPQNAELHRLPIVPSVYKEKSPDRLIQDDPYAVKNARPYDADKATVRRKVLDDLIGVVLIDNQKQLRARWAQTPDAAKLAYIPVTETEIAQLATKWDDDAFRNQKIAEWSKGARAKYQG